MLGSKKGENDLVIFCVRVCTGFPQIMESWKVMESHGKNLSGENGHGKSWNFLLKNFRKIP